MDRDTFFKVTARFGAVTLHGMIISLPTAMFIILGISLCISTNGLLVSAKEEKQKLRCEILRQCMGIVTLHTDLKNRLALSVMKDKQSPKINIHQTII